MNARPRPWPLTTAAHPTVHECMALLHLIQPTLALQSMIEAHNCITLTHGRSIIRSANSGAPHPVLRRYALLRPDRRSAAPVLMAACKYTQHQVQLTGPPLPLLLPPRPCQQPLQYTPVPAMSPRTQQQRPATASQTETPLPHSLLIPPFLSFSPLQQPHSKNKAVLRS